MKRVSAFLEFYRIPLLCAVVAIGVGSCLLNAWLLASPESSLGKYRCTAYCGYYVFQDGMEYKEYQYSQVDFTDNPYFKPVTQDNVEEVLMFVEDYEGWVESLKENSNPDAIELYQSYRYDLASLSESDYYYVKVDDSEYPLHDYKIYIFDRETITLYSLKSWI